MGMGMDEGSSRQRQRRQQQQGATRKEGMAMVCGIGMRTDCGSGDFFRKRAGPP